MKFVLISVVCLLGSALAAPASPKAKRDILPGDPRYGTEHHHHHHHHHGHNPHENELEISEALGGYIGSYSVPDYSAYQNAFDFHVPQGSYGPPNFVPGKPIDFQGFEQQLTQKIQLPSFNKPIADFPSVKSFQGINNGYLSPVAPTTETPVPTYTTAVPTYTSSVSTYAPVAPETKQYLAPVIDGVKKDAHLVDSYGNPATKYEGVAHEPAVEHHNLHVDAPVDSHVDAANDESSVDHSVTVAPVHHEVSVPLVTPVPSHVEDHSHDDAQDDVVEAVKSVKEEHTPVPSPTPVVDHHAVHQTAKPVQPTPSYPSFPQTFSSNYFGNGFDNFGSFDNTGFQSSFGHLSHEITPHTYSQFSSSLGEHGFNFPQGSNSNVFQGGYTRGHAQQSTGSNSFDIKATKEFDLPVQTASPPVQGPTSRPEYAPYHAPQLPSFGQSHVPEFPKFEQSHVPEFPKFEQSHVPEFPKFEQSHVPEFPKFEQSHVPEFPKFEQSHVPEAPKFEQSQLPEFPKFDKTSYVSPAPITHGDAHHDASTSVENFKSSSEQFSGNTQLIGANGGYVY